MATKAYLALGRDGYSVFAQGKVLLEGEALPMLPDILRGHLSTIHYLNASLETCPDGTRRLRTEPQPGGGEGVGRTSHRSPSRAGGADGPNVCVGGVSPVSHSSGAGSGSFGRSPSSAVKQQRRRRLTVERLAANIHVARCVCARTHRHMHTHSVGIHSHALSHT